MDPSYKRKPHSRQRNRVVTQPFIARIRDEIIAFDSDAIIANVKPRLQGHHIAGH